MQGAQEHINEFQNSRSEMSLIISAQNNELIEEKKIENNKLKLI